MRVTRCLGKACAVILVAAGCVLTLGCDRNATALARRIGGMGPSGSPPETIEGLRKAIVAYEDKIEELLSLEAQSGIYCKILAVRLMDRGLYGEALDALDRAVSYFPEDATLHYLSGVCAGIVAKSSHDYGATGSDAVKRRYFALAEESYKRALDLDGRYSRALYGLSVLYVFELDKSREAIPLLERLLEIEKNHVDGMFVLARAYLLDGEDAKAADLYGRIADITKDPQKKQQAQDNRKAVLDGLYGQK